MVGNGVHVMLHSNAVDDGDFGRPVSADQTRKDSAMSTVYCKLHCCWFEIVGN